MRGAKNSGENPRRTRVGSNAKPARTRRRSNAKPRRTQRGSDERNPAGYGGEWLKGVRWGTRREQYGDREMPTTTGAGSGKYLLGNLLTTSYRRKKRSEGRRRKNTKASAGGEDRTKDRRRGSVENRVPSSIPVVESGSFFPVVSRLRTRVYAAGQRRLID